MKTWENQPIEFKNFSDDYLQSKKLLLAVHPTKETNRNSWHNNDFWHLYGIIKHQSELIFGLSTN